MDSELEKRVAREKNSHAENDVLTKNLNTQRRFPHIFHYPSRKRLYEYLDEQVVHMEGKKVLDYGCGLGEESLRYINSGASKVIGIDISTKFINDASRKCEDLNIDRDLYEFIEMDAHDLQFQDNSFDVVIGYAILHHLDPSLALKEIHRVLKPNGRVLLLEPLADNPLLKIFRWATPGIRTVDERPFTGKDITNMFSSDLWERQMKYCGILEAPFAILTSIVMPEKEENFVLRFADKIEKWLHDRNLFLSWNQYVLFDCLKRG